MNRRFAGKRVIVTGGSRGIGYRVAKAFLAAGAEVLIVGRSVADLEGALVGLTETSPSVSCFVGDMSDAGAVGDLVDTALERWTRIDALVNNAGLFHAAPFLEMERDDWSEALAMNLTAPFLLAQRVGRAMVRSGGGAIVNVASVNAHGADGGTSAYSSAKAGLLALTKAVAVELGEHGVRCNSVSPTYVSTEKLEAALPAPLYRHVMEEFARVPIRRAVTPEEVAAACLFLASDDASGVTGCDLPVDGGTLADLYIGASLPPVTA